MFFDLDVPLPNPGAQISAVQGASQKKGKQKQKQQQQQQQQNVSESSSPPLPPLVFTPAQIAAIDARIDFLVHLGYSVIALNQVVQSRVDARTHVDWLQGLVHRLKKRRGVVVLKRLTVVGDEGEKGNGINPQNASVLAGYDILSLRPLTQQAFSEACLAHTQPSPLTVHVISIPATLPPRLPFHLKHTLVRTALKNGAVFEVGYAGALGAEGERRSWWGAAREVVRVTKGKGIIVSGGAAEAGEIRAPRDVANLITLLGIPQNLSHDAITSTPKAVVLHAQSRKTYRSILSEPRIVFPPSSETNTDTPGAQASPVPTTQSTPQAHDAQDVSPIVNPEVPTVTADLTLQKQGTKREGDPIQPPAGRSKNKKRS